jgi:calcium-dependent protein kinase
MRRWKSTAAMASDWANSENTKPLTTPKKNAPNIKGFGPATITPKKQQQRIEHKYHIEFIRNPYGHGRKTIVRKCIERKTGKRFAVKTVRKKDKEEYRQLIKEANFLKELDHPTIVKIKDLYENENYLHMVVDRCNGGDLYDRVVGKAQGNKRMQYDESEAATIVRKVVDAVAYLHANDIAHRDLTLENIMFQRKQGKQASEFDVRLVDFGLSKKMKPDKNGGAMPKSTTFVGTNYYIAPEVLQRGHTNACDIWSIGVLTYALISTKPPFGGTTDEEIYYNILHCDETGVQFPSPEWDGVSENAKDFIRDLLKKDETQRPTAAQLTTHPWLESSLFEKSAASSIDKSHYVSPLLQKYMYLRGEVFGTNLGVETAPTFNSDFNSEQLPEIS